MAKKDFDKYYDNMKSTFISTVEMAEEMRKDALEGNVDEVRVKNFLSVADPIIRTFRILQDVKRLLDKPVRKNKLKQFMNTTKHLAPESPEYDIQNIYEEGVAKLEQFKETIE